MLYKSFPDFVYTQPILVTSLLQTAKTSVLTKTHIFFQKTVFGNGSSSSLTVQNKSSDLSSGHLLKTAGKGF